jgi:hypothetical protein
MQKAEKQKGTGIKRSVRLDKGYITRLKKLVKKKGFGGIQYVADEAKIDRDTVSSTISTGRCNKTNKEKLQRLIDSEMPEPTKAIKRNHTSANAA